MQAQHTEIYQQSPLWKEAFRQREDGLDEHRGTLAKAYADFRSRVATLCSHIGQDMKGLTVHDITHIDALWWVAAEITGPDYPLNPAEAFVLGGAFLLHDAAHCVAAFPGGIEEVMALPEWNTFCNLHKVNPESLTRESEPFKQVLFDVLRAQHPKQARKLAFASWCVPGESTPMFLLQHDELRSAYGDTIGQLAESHWHHPHQLELLGRQTVQPIALLHPAPWQVDVLKLALILRTADAAHIDAQRAPRFLQALRKPMGASLQHWKFQSRLNRPTRDPDPQRKELRLSASPFPATEKEAWWLAYDAAKMIDSELRASERLLLDHKRDLFAVRSVANVHDTESFSHNVPTVGWHPVDTSVKISNINQIVERFGGHQLYGNDPAAALRELIQNARDAINACRSLGGLEADEGEIEVWLEPTEEGDWLHVTDNGIGMSRYVLTDILLDFGKSLWKSEELRGEWEQLSATDFESVGKFGIGFFSVFMLGSRVTLTTRRYESKENESSQWLLEFTEALKYRPTLRTPTDHEKLKRHGTRISVMLDGDQLEDLLGTYSHLPPITLAEACAKLAPALNVNLSLKHEHKKISVIKANDWLTIDETSLLSRINPEFKSYANHLSYSSHLHEIRNKKSEIIGRIGLLTVPYYRVPGTGCAGVHRGIFTAEVRGLTGVICTHQQQDLARSRATPLCTAGELESWLNVHAPEVIERYSSDLEINSLLGQLGVDKALLTIGWSVEGLLSYRDLVVKLRKLDILAIHDGEVTPHKEDDVHPRDFEKHITYAGELLIIGTAIRVDWIKQLEKDTPPKARDTYQIVEKALSEAWGAYTKSSTEEIFTVATVLGNEIERECFVYTRQAH
ncbi:HD domain-containing protein [Pseudomonas entomophila]|uniref:HD domain-containing protein n=1 Tax=Pseudomonas entomophila TaxID=312306 RepID=UPI001EFF69D7|nr:ATP-binding protein [Pseudomonas entomophila]MCG8292026.1 ATP-binding protein [Pseudomonas entomophila]